MPRITFDPHFTYTAFVSRVPGDDTPFHFGRESVPTLSQSTMDLINELLDIEHNYPRPIDSATKALSLHSNLQVIPALAESVLKITVAASTLAAGRPAYCYLTGECDPYSLPAIVQDNQEAVAVSAAFGIGSGVLADLWSNVRRRWSEGDAALVELELALNEQASFVSTYYKTLKNLIKDELAQPVAKLSPIKSVQRKAKAVKNPREEILNLALKELKRAKNFAGEFNGPKITLINVVENDVYENSSSKKSNSRGSSEKSPQKPRNEERDQQSSSAKNDLAATPS